MFDIARYSVGEFDVAVVSDGHIRLDAGATMGIIPRVMWEPVLGPNALDTEYRMKLGLNCLLVRRGEDVMLIDTGMGNKHDARVRERLFPGEHGQLLGALESLGLTPRDITAVANTHLHADHCGWNTLRVGDELVPTFPRARYFMSAGEFEAALHPNERTRGTYFPENFQPLAGTGQLELVDGEREILPGVVFVPAPGHTADHAVLILHSARESLVYTGDLVHHEVQLERLAWIPSFDILPMVSLETKRTLTERAIRERSLLVSTHVSFPGIGRLVENDGRRAFVRE